MLALSLAFSRKTEEQERRKKKMLKSSLLFTNMFLAVQRSVAPGMFQAIVRFFLPHCIQWLWVSLSHCHEWLWVTVSFFFFGTFKSENKMLHPRSSAGLCVPQCRQQSFTLVTTCASSSSKFISLPHRHGHGHKQHVLWKSTLQLRLYFICYI